MLAEAMLLLGGGKEGDGEEGTLKEPVVWCCWVWPCGALFFLHGPVLPSTMPPCHSLGQAFQTDLTCCSLSPGKLSHNLRYPDVQIKHSLIITHQRMNVITLFIIYLVCVSVWACSSRGAGKNQFSPAMWVPPVRLISPGSRHHYH